MSKTVTAEESRKVTERGTVGKGKIRFLGSWENFTQPSKYNYVQCSKSCSAPHTHTHTGTQRWEAVKCTL